MEYNITFKLYGKFFSSFLKKDERALKEKTAVMGEYEAILKRAKPMNPKNNLTSSYALAAFFISMVRKTPLNEDECLKIIDECMRNSKIIKMAMGDADAYLSPKKYQKTLEWSKESHKKLYPNDWVVDILPKCDEYDLGYNYLECGVCKLCRDEGCPELAHYLCSLDFMLVEIMGLGLRRTQTLAEGGDYCDFRFYRK